MAALIWSNQLLWFFATFFLTSGLSFAALRSHHSQAESEFGRLLLFQSLWVLGQGLELAASSLSLKLWLDGLQYVPMMLSATAALRFAFRFAGRRLPQKLLLVYASVASPIVLFFLTAPLHGLARTDAHLVAGDPFVTLHYAFIPGDLVLVLWSFLANTYSFFVVAQSALSAHRFHFIASLPIILGFSLPTLLTLPAFFLEFRVLGQRDLSFVVFGGSGLLALWGLRKQNSLVTVPVARDLLFERSPDAALVLDRNLRVLEVNEAACQLLRLSNKSSILGRPVSTLSQVRVESSPLWARLAEDGEIPTVQLADGRVWRIIRHFMPDLGAQLLLLRDVTEEETLKRLQSKEKARLELAVQQRTRELASSERKFRAMFDQSIHLIGLLTPTGTLVEANATALSLAHVPADQVLGKPFWDTPWWQHSPELQEQLKNAINRAARGESLRFEATHPLADGELRTIDFSLKAVFDEQGQVILLIPEGRDITELRKTEDQLRQSMKMESLGRLAGGIAHDFNNLLTIILGNLTLAQEIKDDATHQELLNEAERAAVQAAKLTGQMLAFGRKSMLQLRPLDLADCLDSAVALLRRSIGENHLIETRIEPQLGNVMFDDAQLKQVFFNLIINARDAMPEGGKIVISARALNQPSRFPASSEQIEVEITDTGTGMDEATRDRIFEPFYTTKPPGVGTGLGLSMVYGAMVQHGGSVDVQSELGHGTTFRLRFPRSSARDLSPPSEPHKPSTPAHDCLVYLIEDEASVRSVIVRQLSQAGFPVRAFEDGVSFIHQIAQLEKPGVVLTDAIMPQVSGYDVMGAVKQRWSQVPTIVISGYSEDDKLRQAISAGAHFLGKPFASSQLLEALHKVLNDGPSGAELN